MADISHQRGKFLVVWGGEEFRSGNGEQCQDRQTPLVSKEEERSQVVQRVRQMGKDETGGVERSQERTTDAYLRKGEQNWEKKMNGGEERWRNRRLDTKK